MARCYLSPSLLSTSSVALELTLAPSHDNMIVCIVVVTSGIVVNRPGSWVSFDVNLPIASFDVT